MMQKEKNPLGVGGHAESSKASLAFKEPSLQRALPSRGATIRHNPLIVVRRRQTDKATRPNEASARF
jgi:hypothetical protein